mmetsp:Transcript_11720/g.17665  ORF Transcript_11720/g.17665 Transcript_11720/m.17665 type:complete len:98 (-) Transcript_11720:24-317(-)
MGSSNKEYGVTFVMIMSAWAVPILLFLGWLCFQGSHMVELPHDQKQNAAWGCWGSAVLYGGTFFGAMKYKNELAASARQVPLHVSQEMRQVTEGTRF